MCCWIYCVTTFFFEIKVLCMKLNFIEKKSVVIVCLNYNDIEIKCVQIRCLLLLYLVFHHAML